MCEIAIVVVVFRGIHILGGLSIPWCLLEKLADAWKEKPTKIISGGVAPSTGFEKSRGSVPAVGELPPEVVAPGLRKMQKSSGFGSGGGKTHSDSQFHKRNKDSAGSKSGGESAGGDDTPDSSPTGTTKAETNRPQKGGG